MENTSVISTKEISFASLEDFIRKAYPKQHAEFAKAPWDFNIIATDNNLEESAQFIVTLKIGKRRCRKTYIFRLFIVSAHIQLESVA